MESKVKRTSTLHNRGCLSYLFWGCWFGITAAGWVRFGISLRDWYWLNRAGVGPGAAYLVISGGLWGLIGLAVLVWMGLRRPAYPWVGMAAAMFYALTYWLDRLMFSRPDGSWVNLPFALILTVLGLVFVFMMLRPVQIDGWKMRNNGK